ncbi:MAG: AAA family ATPase [Candidatus Eremiobacteraeota bacterium]|nr:AAA family ATPase [Candidatus Eremiobacteraeota bacterium]MCW5872862.1 AAA family ATPase [Candidatus Eremiobacteraeota bacterium]
MLNSLQLKGFRSIHSLGLELRPLNILIGANGAGKSNLIAFFKLLNEMTAGRLQEHIARTGRARSLLYRGPQVTPQLEFRLAFSDDQAESEYHARLLHASGDTLVFAQETLALQGAGRPRKDVELGAGHLESALSAKQGPEKGFRSLLSQCRVYHFHDTSDTAAMRGFCYVHDRWPLMPQAQNLAAFLYGLRESQFDYYARILTTIQLVAPFLEDFVLEPQANDIILNWRERGSDLLMGPHQLSDGSLRAIALIALLLQPEDKLPKMIVVDEPELGLHPYALEVIASLFDKASVHTQILLSTQSSNFLDHFEAEDVIVAERNGDGSRFHRLDLEQLEAWLEGYSLGEVWQKNLIGGGPQ